MPGRSTPSPTSATSATSATAAMRTPGRRREALVVVALLALCIGFRAKTGDGWSFVGADSFAYVGAAKELVENHRYGFRLPDWYKDRPKETAPGYGRLPGYPVLLSAVAATVPAPRADLEIFARTKPVQYGLDALTGLLVYLVARRLAGRRAAVIALAIWSVLPFPSLYASAILSECLATCLSFAFLALVFFAADRRASLSRARLAFVLAGALCAANTLVRIDGIVLAPVLLVPLLWRSDAVKVRHAFLCALAFAVVFSPWPLRNQSTFGAPHPFGNPCDIRGREMPYTAFFGWFATWLRYEEQGPPTLYCLLRPECVASVSSFPAEAFDTPEEKKEVARLFAERAKRGGYTPEIDEAFRTITRDKIRRDPVRFFVKLPLERAAHLWIARFDQPLRATGHAPWPAVYDVLVPRFLGLTVLLVAATLAGALSLLAFPPHATARAAVAIFFGAIALRTAFMALIGFVENRYTLELMPGACVLAAALVARWADWVFGAPAPSPDDVAAAP